MKTPLSWLRDFVDITLSPEALAERLTLAGLEVESITCVGVLWDRDRIFVGQVLEVTRHPEAESLVLAQVDYGHGQPLTVVTGAPNMYPLVGHDLSTGRGPKVALALTGARLVDGHSDRRRVVTLETSKLRGITSEGMICSEKELDLTDSHEGILILPQDAPLGMPLFDYMGDHILEFDVKGPFGHLQSVIGVAREVAVLTEQPLRRDVLKLLEHQSVEIVPDTEFTGIVIDAPDLCPRYSAALIEDLQIGPSPFWMQQRLQHAGIRPINNVVDVTNYVMLELGQPLHAFDYDLLRERAATSGQADGRPVIIIRRAHPTEHIITIDDVDRALDPEMLLITDTKGAIAVAGVMGGAETEVHNGTTSVLLESANFNFLSIRRTADRLKLQSEASKHFGKGVDPELTVVALARAGQLLGQLTASTVVPIYGDVYPSYHPLRTIDLNPAYVTRLLGIQISVPEMVRILSALEFEVDQEIQGTEDPDSIKMQDASPLDPGTPPSLLHVTIPSHRLDVNIPADLVEEIGRIYGYDQLPMTLMRDELPPQRRNVSLEGEELVRDVLVGAGLDESITYSMINIADDARLRVDGSQPNASEYVPIRNPLTADRAHMRRSLLAGLVNTARANLRFQDRITIFEVGRVFLPIAETELPTEPRRVSALLIGPLDSQTWLPHDTRPLDFFDLKGMVEALSGRLGLADVTWERATHPAMHPGRTAHLLVGDANAGVVGELHPLVRAAFDLPDQPVALMELDLEVLLADWGTARSMVDISTHPVVYEDLAVIVDDKVTAAAVAQLIRHEGGELLIDAHLFDIYQGEQVPLGKKSLAFALTFQAPDRTLTDEDVRKLRLKIINRLEYDLGATLRSVPNPG